MYSELFFFLVSIVWPQAVVVVWLSSNVHGRVFSESEWDMTNGNDWKAREHSLFFLHFLWIYFVCIFFIISFSFFFITRSELFEDIGESF